jgi:hypothetical protein
MSDPTPRTFAPVWLSPADVKSWLKLYGQDADDDALIQAVCAQTEPYVARCRPEWWDADRTVYTPDDETYQGARMYAAREYRRRNSPSGIESFGDVTSFVARFDPDIDRALQTGVWARPVVS